MIVNNLLFSSYIVIGVATLILGFLVVRRGIRRPTNRYFFYFATAILLWLVSNAITQLAGSATLTFWIRATFFTASLMMLALVEFIFVFPKPISHEFSSVRYLVSLPGLIIAVLSMGHFIVERVQKVGNINEVVYGPLFQTFTLYVLLSALTATVMAYWNFKRSSGIGRQQILFLLAGIAIGAVFASMTDLIAPLFGNEVLPNFGPLSIAFVVGFTSYAIIAHRLFDIRVIIKRTVIYSGLLTFVIGSYSLVIFTIASLFGTRSGISTDIFLPNLIGALVVAAGFEPIRRFLVATTDKYLFVGEYRPEEVLRELSQNLSEVIDLDEALQGMMQILVKSMRLRRSATFVLRRFKGEMEVKRVKQIGFTSPDKLKLAKQDPLVDHFEERLKARRETNERRHFALVTEELARRIEEDGKVPPIVPAIKERLADLGAAVALPLIVKNQLIGILILSDKLSGDIYTSSDLDLLEIVAHETAGAIEKARFWEEDQLKSEFVSIASHELLTPTSTIQGYLSMILDEGMGKVDPKAREYLERVRVTSKRLTELVQDLLNVSRIEGGRIKINPLPMNLLETLRQVVEDLAPQAREKGLSLHLEDPSRIDSKVITVFADPDRVRQVLVNIIGNAVKYTPRGGVTVSVTKLGRLVKVAVADTGVGMSPEERKHLFEKFYRIQNEATRGISGTGLGLYITKNIIELMGGTITVESTAGKGSVFSCTFPVTETKHLSSASAEPPIAKQSLPPRPREPVKVGVGAGGKK